MTVDTTSDKPRSHGERSPDIESHKSLGEYVALAIAIIPTLGCLTGLMAYATVGITTLDVSLFLVMLGISSFGMHAGFHRYFTHQAYKTGPFLERFLGIAGSTAGEGPVIWWVAIHRRHHQFADKQQDPHSPHNHGPGVRAFLGGLFHAHFGWFFSNEFHGKKAVYYALKHASDLIVNPRITAINNYYAVWVVSGILLPGCIGGLVGGSVSAASSGLLWGGLVRLFVVQHGTWAINSLGHMYGGRGFETNDKSTNNVFVGIVTLGEWHNNHHTFQYSARQGLLWWQVDIHYLVLRALEKVSLVSELRTPSAEAIESRGSR